MGVHSVSRTDVSRAIGEAAAARLKPQIKILVFTLQRTITMSLIPAIRDYIDLLNSSFDSISVGADIKLLILPTFWYILGSLKYVAVYLLSLRWLRDLIELPLLVPQLSLSIVKGNCYTFESPILNVLTFLEYGAHKENRFLIGFFNSFFSALPITSAHILAGRRLLVQGIPAGIAAGSGVVLGQCWFVACVVLGLRGLLMPWLSLEPVNYLVGLGLLVNIVYRITHERRIRIAKWSDKRELLGYFAISLLLTWCEQSSIFQYLGNLTAGTEPTVLESFSSGNDLSSFLAEGSYLLGFLVGSCAFTVFFGYLAHLVRKMWLRAWSITSSRLTNQLNRAFLAMLIAFSLASIPYYGIDYLVAKAVGFLPRDKALEGTVLYPSSTEDIAQNLGRMSNSKSFDTDISTFDRGLYLQDYQPFPQSFEDLNYQGEYGWTKRISKAVKHVLKTNTPLAWHKLLGSQGNSEATTEALVATEDPSASTAFTRSGEARSENIAQSAIFREESAGKETNEASEEEAVSGLLALEAQIAKPTPATSLGNEPNSDISYMAQAATEDNELENEFLSLFDTGLSPLFIAEMPEPSVLEKSLKRRVVENPLYHLLLRLDVDSFLHRQPASHSVSPLEETILFQKRQIIGHYYNTLREYNRLQNWEDFRTLCRGSKSYANRVYNHQFKGTLKVVRRLFSITFDPEQNVGGNRVLKFDQPLFKDSQRRASLNLHEELMDARRDSSDTSPFLEITDPKPLYAGWDEELRKLVVTNRSLPRSEALYRAGTIGREKMKTGHYDRLHEILAKEVSFTAWPISAQALTDSKSQLEVPYQVAFESGNNPRKERLAEALHSFAEAQDQGAVGGSTWDMSRWPANLKLLDERPGPLPSTRGGFVWPGHWQLKIGKSERSTAAD